VILRRTSWRVRAPPVWCKKKKNLWPRTNPLELLKRTWNNVRDICADDESNFRVYDVRVFFERSRFSFFAVVYLFKVRSVSNFRNGMFHNVLTVPFARITERDLRARTHTHTHTQWWTSFKGNWTATHFPPRFLYNTYDRPASGNIIARVFFNF